MWHNEGRTLFTSSLPQALRKNGDEINATTLAHEIIAEWPKCNTTPAPDSGILTNRIEQKCKMRKDLKMLKEVFIVLENADMTEGRGPMVPTGYSFTTEEAAIEYCKMQQGVMGVKNDTVVKYRSTVVINDHEIRKIKVFENIKDIEEVQLKELKEIALSKLTNEEKSILGL